MEVENNLKVSVVMITYGHDLYIEQAIRSVLHQKYSSEVELIVANDNSPDRTDEIITKLINEHEKSGSIKYINREMNIGMMPNFLDAVKQATGGYIAICDGDDYWLDCYKLQKQVDFLSQNRGYSFTCTNFLQQFGNEKEISGPLINIANDANITLKSFLDKSIIGTLTVVARTNILKAVLNKYTDSEILDWGMADYPLWLELLHTADGRFLNFNSSCYRILANSASGRQTFSRELKFHLKALEILNNFLNHSENVDYQTKKLGFVRRYEEIFSLISQRGTANDFKLIEKKMIEHGLEKSLNIKLSYVKLNIPFLMNIYRYLRKKLNG